ncbi:gephyrin-like molybdotransferase Glp [Cellulosimicrobium protaetiae]|uniref:Molybdopterin molybdenumtransferase n=1 Tax=Cellulosimicrobium protaetiae TaxID=2587808 RepID=A0A6M5UJA2_9MICO|nr:gephyrin-like molybdotransferase Glp [Cellulosimicrobium protaetiae]QJW37415.1 molybdopterin molybdotransferase MoeA [Cellulosimicrobium protaetiae]
MAGTARVSVDEHRADVAALLAPLVEEARRRARTEEVLLADALGRVLAGDLAAPVAVPLFRNSQMDGYAVRAADVAGASPDAPVRLVVVAEIPAAPGVPTALAPGAAARIMTGAPVPDGADAVVPVEDTGTGSFAGTAGTGSTGGAAGDERARGSRDDAPGSGPRDVVEVRAPRAPGDFVREAGSDVRPGDVLLADGTVLAPHHLAAAAACGVGSVRVVARPRVAVLSTGSELVGPGETPGPGQVFDANADALGAAVRRAGGDVVLTARCGDDAARFAAVLAEAAAVADLVVTSGGVSQGAYEVVKDVLAGSGAVGSRVVDQGAGQEAGRAASPVVTFRSVAMQPGGPQGFGTVHGTPVLTFPGNPVSAQVSFAMFLREPLERAAGLPAVDRVRTAVLAEGLTSPAGKHQLLRGATGPDGTVRVVGGAGSHLVAAMARADVLVDVPADVTQWDAGTEVEVREL